MNEYSMMTQELQDLAALSMEHGQLSLIHIFDKGKRSACREDKAA